MITDLEPSPNRRALELTGRDYVSFSALSTYQRCPLQHHFRYVAGLPEATVSASLVFGSAIHRAAEFHFRELLSGNPAPDLDTLLDCYQQEWRDRDGTPISFPKRDDVDSLGQLAERVLTAFRDSDVADPQGTILGVEEELRGAAAQRDQLAAEVGELKAMLAERPAPNQIEILNILTPSRGLI